MVRYRNCHCGLGRALLHDEVAPSLSDLSGPVLGFDPSLAIQAQIEAMQEGTSERDVTQVNAPHVLTLEGVQCLRQLKNLNVEGSPISDLSPLGGHPALGRP